MSFFSNPFVEAFVLFFILFLVFRIVFFILEKILLKITLKTKTNLDDIILKESSAPINLLLLFVALRVTLGQINLGISVGVLDMFNKLILTVIVLSIGYLIYVISDLVLGRAFKKFVARTESKLDDSLFTLVHSVLKIALVILVLLYVLSVWGVEILPLMGALGIAGLAVALALQPVLANIFSGASMILDKSVSKGDLVYLDAHTKGKILKVGMRSTRILTFDNELIIVPNSKLAESTIQNVALPELISRVVIPFGVAYGSDIEKVKKIVLKEVKTVKNVVLDEDREPRVRFLKMADSSLNFKAYFYVDTYEERFNAIDEINTKIYNSLNKAGIEIPFPQVDIHLKK
ncbi:mechanosensitive ion channel [archaeon]|nr:mechanosensitive ion channel [archaeon]